MLKELERGKSVKETACKAGKGRAQESVLRNNCRPIICIVFRILKGTLKLRELSAHLDNCTGRKTRKVLKDQLQLKVN